MSTLIYAHRGASAYKTENTMSAFSLASLQGADGIETDVQLSQDDAVVICHDETVDRVWNGSGPVKSHTYEQLRAMRAKNAPADKQAYIPTLWELLQFCAAKKLLLNIELKNSVEPYPGMEEKVLELVAKADMKDLVIYSSFNHMSMEKMKGLDKTVRTGLLYDEIMEDPWDYAKRLNAWAIHPAQNSLYLPDLILNCHEHGVAVNIWTVNDPGVMHICVRQGADGIITNVPDVARELLQRSGRNRMGEIIGKPEA